ncbi:MAG: FtsX-like permease family protein [Eubacterium sp.]|nr:FtsX-like permease family protein [Eubacterium sp.]
MKKIYIVDSWRRMKRTIVSACAIALIVGLGISTYLGISFAKISLEDTGDYHYDKQKFHDCEVLFPYGITDEDIKELSKLDGVDAVEGIRRTTGFLTLEEEKRLLTVQSVTKTVDVAKLIDGRLPTAKNEVAIEKLMSDEDGLKIGDVLDIDCKDKDDSSLLLHEKLKVVGIVEHPTYSCSYVYSRRGLSEKGSGNCLNFVLVSDSAFDQSVLDGSYQSAVILSNKLQKLNCFSNQYVEERKQLMSDIRKIATTLGDQRYQKVKSDADDKVSDAQDKLDDAKKKLDKADQDIKSGEKKVKEAKKDLEQFKEDYPGFDVSEFEDKIKEAQDDLSDSKAEEKDAKKKYNNSKTELDDKKEDLDKLVKLSWNVHDRSDNISYVMYKDNEEGLGKLSFSFAFVYIVVAFMVCYSSIGRMITKQKKLIGTQKALGFRPREIMTQYLSYSWVCTLAGSIFSIFFSVLVVEKLSLDGYRNLYYFKDYFRSYDVHQTLIVVIAAFILTTISTIFACKKQISKPTVMLLKDEIVGDGKELFFEEFYLWKKISLFKRTTIKNLLNEKRHLITTIVGVAGCTALMIIGFTLKFAITDVRDEQFNNIQKYDISLQVEADKNGMAFASKLNSFTDLEYINFMDKMVEVKLNNEDNIVADLLCVNVAQLQKYFMIENTKNHKKVTTLDEGVLISSNTAEYYKLKVNDKIQVTKENGERISLPIKGIVKNYVCHFIVISPEYYKKAMNEEVKNNIYFVKLNGTKRAMLKDAVKEEDGYIELAGKEMGKSIFKSIADSLNSAIQVMILLSGIMALIVVLNLLVMYINEKSKPLAVMRINGYTINECKKFITFSNTILNIVGLLIGVVVGVLIGTQIIRTIANDCVTYCYDPNIKACVLGCAISIGYTIVITTIANRKINHLELTNLNRFD